MSAASTISSGVISATKRHNGLLLSFAARSHTAFMTAAIARCSAPLSGPIHRSWVSEASSR